MEKEYLIKKWLDNDLSPEEKEAFRALNDYDSLIKISNYSKFFEAKHYSYKEAMSEFETRIKGKSKPTFKRWYNPLLKIAAIFIVTLGIYFFQKNTNTNISANVAEMIVVKLPDSSMVNLNALSKITYNPKTWQHNREVTLKGEAFFKVAKGRTFDVLTNAGKITVLGTQFNVKQRNNYFEVTCYEGLVRVNHKTLNTKLTPGQSFIVINNAHKITYNKEKIENKPDWLSGISTFKSMPLKNVLSEFERQYKTKIIYSGINDKQLFTGKFTHDNLDLAIKSILLPLNITYEINNSTIILKNE